MKASSFRRMKFEPPIPSELWAACEDPAATGDYLLSSPCNWLQPYDADGVDVAELNRDFDGLSETEAGLLVGSVRICNTGCEGYHVYVYRGPSAGEVWSDQRVPYGRVERLASSLTTYLEAVRRLGRRHVAYWSQSKSEEGPCPDDNT